MVSFESDYIAGAHPEVLEKLVETNLETLTGYGFDKYSDSAKEKIKKAIGIDDVQVEFIAGGTQTNAVVISTMLKDYEGVIAAKTGHIAAHEAGAIEYTGHEVLELPQVNGKLDAKDIKEYLDRFYADGSHEHMTFPGMVYISHPTEYGTLYTKDELKSIYELCNAYSMTLFIDGARLGYGLMSKDTDLNLHDIASHCDVFYIGGTKVGALCGEAVVFTHGNRPAHFLTSVKKRGALLAKGRLVGVQFDALFTEGLYLRIGKHGIAMAEKLKALFAAKGIKMFIDSPTNQQFPILEDSKMEKLKEKLAFTEWEKYDEDHTVVRFATSWSTTDEDMKALEDALNEVYK